MLEDELLGSEASYDLDRLKILIDVSERGISGYQAADWLREHEHLDMGLSDHAHILATISITDDTTATERLLRAHPTRRGGSRASRTRADRDPDPADLELEIVNRPRDAFFSRFQDVKAKDAAGRIAAQQITPYPSAWCDLFAFPEVG